MPRLHLSRSALALSSLCFATFTACAPTSANDAAAPQATAETAQTAAPSFDSANAVNITLPLIKADRTVIGQLILKEASGGVIARVTASEIPIGWHGMHFHVKADCGDTAFKNSGGHINPSGKEHGLRNPNGPDNADLPNIYANDEGFVDAEVFSTRVALRDGIPGRPNLLDSDGSALVIHASEDDQVTQPIGGAGARIACAEIRQ